MNSFIQLEYDKIKNWLKQECHSENGKKIADELQPFDDKKEIEKRLFLTAEIQEMLKNGFSFNFEAISDLSKLLNNFEHQSYNFEELKLIIGNLRVANLISSVRDKLENYPRFLGLTKNLVSLSDLEKRFQQIFTPDGEVKDNASPELQIIRKNIFSVRKRIISTLNNKLENFAAENYLFDKIVTQREGRFVIPIKMSAVPFVPGIVHSRSASKSSVYLEPQEIIGLNNETRLLKNEEKQEIFRILKSFSEKIKDKKDVILQNTDILSETDFYFAAARLANNLQANVPEIVEQPVISLQKARHPLLIKNLGDIKKVVPFSLKLGENFRIMVVSGPNTGGKTVTLKAVGLLTLMVLSGLPIPADESSKIGIFQKIFADIGDNQSLENSLSTFSSHLQNIGEMISEGTPKSLVLIDELGSATDPEQGAALAQAILERLTEMNVIGIITTHYNSLKIIAEKNENCVNAAMLFDPKKHSPTYRLKLGFPGNSFALEIASKLGLDEKLVKRAKELSGKQNVELTDLLVKIGEEKAELARQIFQYQLKTKLLEQKISSYEKKLKTWEEENKNIRKKSLGEAREFLINLQKDLNEEISRIKSSEKLKRKQQLEQLVNKVRMLDKKLKKEEEEISGLKREPLKNPRVGSTVWLNDIETAGEIVEIKKDKIKVDVNGMIYTTNLQNLARFSKKIIENKFHEKRLLPKKLAKIELKILGKTFEEALPEIETFLDDAIFAGINKVRIVHGKGTGALRTKVRLFLKQNKKIAEFYSPPPSAGGDGVTIAVIKE